MEETDNHIGRGGSLKDFSYYDECMLRGLKIIDVDENRKDEAASLCAQAKKMCTAHSCHDPYRNVRVAVHQLIYEIHESMEG